MHALALARVCKIWCNFSDSCSTSLSVCLSFSLSLSVFQSSAFIFATSRQGQGHCTFTRRLKLRKLREQQRCNKRISSTFLLSLTLKSCIEALTLSVHFCITYFCFVFIIFLLILCSISVIVSLFYVFMFICYSLCKASSLDLSIKLEK